MEGALDPDDQTVLSFIAAHDLVLSSQARQVTGEHRAASVSRLARLVDAGLVQRSPRLAFQHAAYQITRAGLDRLESDLPMPDIDVRIYWQGLALAWLWVHAHKGHFGPVDRIYSRRAMRASDAASAGALHADLVSPDLRAKLADVRFALALDGGRVRHPGLVLVHPQGRIALEYLLSAPSRRWVDEVLDGYAAKPHVTVAIVIALRGEWRDGLRYEIERRGLGDQVRAQQGAFAFTAT